MEAYYQGIGDSLCRRREANARSGLEVLFHVFVFAFSSHLFLGHVRLTLVTKQTRGRPHRGKGFVLHSPTQASQRLPPPPRNIPQLLFKSSRGEHLTTRVLYSAVPTYLTPPPPPPLSFLVFINSYSMKNIPINPGGVLCHARCG